jgi:hypothetical protein
MGRPSHTMPKQHFFLTICLPQGDQQNSHKMYLKIKAYSLHVINSLVINFCCWHHMTSATLVHHTGVGQDGWWWGSECEWSCDREMGNKQSHYLFTLQNTTVTFNWEMCGNINLQIISLSSLFIYIKLILQFLCYQSHICTCHSYVLNKGDFHDQIKKTDFECFYSLKLCEVSYISFKRPLSLFLSMVKQT